ncbi:hypothetical protein ACIQAC_04310 [Streptomyces sp. NPDC088387]|uniref:hypothetical protein n=1 Tax=Streptomyces sp. NPDC088387 TaxID=3365859 RepID=UPI0037F86494
MSATTLLRSSPNLACNHTGIRSRTVDATRPDPRPAEDDGAAAAPSPDPSRPLGSSSPAEP